eukprot:TRINITY_DN4059_c0_g1_i5.p1 TRINITY_DN4059_c0_g1~~TRINITY_DN4059_c0_g1_i5.p1  ORF type:complete len:319 (-),score=-16.12 TRINITY_DN4059_c0_g1_i5:100-927(-)
MVKCYTCGTNSSTFQNKISTHPVKQLRNLPQLVWTIFCQINNLSFKVPKSQVVSFAAVTTIHKICDNNSKQQNYNEWELNGCQALQIYQHYKYIGAICFKLQLYSILKNLQYKNNQPIHTCNDTSSSAQVDKKQHALTISQTIITTPLKSYILCFTFTYCFNQVTKYIHILTLAYQRLVMEYSFSPSNIKSSEVPSANQQDSSSIGQVLVRVADQASRPEPLKSSVIKAAESQKVTCKYRIYQSSSTDHKPSFIKAMPPPAVCLNSDQLKKLCPN